MYAAFSDKESRMCRVVGPARKRRILTWLKKFGYYETGSGGYSSGRCAESAQLLSKIPSACKAFPL